MKISACLVNTADQHLVRVTTNGADKALEIGPRPGARGSVINGGELLVAALATCLCNDLVREAGKRGIELGRIDVAVSADFPTEGAPAENVVYDVTVSGEAEDSVLRDLVLATDRVAEIQNTVRSSVPVKVSNVTVVPLREAPAS